MEFYETRLDGVFVLQPSLLEDERGYFLETYREEMFLDCGLNINFVQDNFSLSKRGVVRGLHYQIGEASQVKLVMVCHGEILDVAVDIRENSPTFGKHVSVRLNTENHKMVFIPEGFAHGFSVLSEEAKVYYKCSNYYNRELERGIRWNDSRLKIDWQVKTPLVSEKDSKQPLLSELSGQDLF